MDAVWALDKLKIMSMISVGCDFTTKSGGICRVLGPLLVRNQVVQVHQPRQKRRLAPTRMVEALHGEQLPVHGVVRLVQPCTHRRHLGVFEYRIPAWLFVLDPVAPSLTVFFANRRRTVIDKAAQSLTKRHHS